MKKVLVTGASGLIGRQCLRRLLSRGHEVCASHLKSSAGDSPGVRWHLPDLLAPKAVVSLVPEAHPTHILHTASTTTLGEYWTP